MSRLSALMPVALLCTCYDAEGNYNFYGQVGGTEVMQDVPLVDLPDLPVARVEPELRLDVPGDKSCESLDVLFVIDNSGSMAEEQEQLTASVPGFIQFLQSMGIGFDLHIAVTTTDENQANLPECQTLGALSQGRQHTFYEHELCLPYSTDMNYMTQEDLEGEFQCAMLAGTWGYGAEAIVGAAIEALKPSISESDGNPFGYRLDDCNIGFRREDASLLVILLTDEDDRVSSGDPEFWAAALTYLAYDQELLVVGFIPNENCETALFNGDRLREFLNLVPSYEASICSNDYASELTEATWHLVSQCGTVLPEP